MKRRKVVFAVFAAYVFALGQGSIVERTGSLCAETGAANDKQNAEYGVRLFAPILSPPSYGTPNVHSSGYGASTVLNPSIIASALTSDPVLHALYRPLPASDYHVIVHPLFTARDAALWWNQTWQTALASRWRALALIRKELLRDPVVLHPVVQGFRAGRYSLSIELEVNSGERAIIQDIWEMVTRTSGINLDTLKPHHSLFSLRIPIAYRRIDPESGKCCFCCPSKGTLSIITGLPASSPSLRAPGHRDDETEECCMTIEDDENENSLKKRVAERLTALLQDDERSGGRILPAGTPVRVGIVQMGHTLRQGDLHTPKHWAIHYLLPGGKDERYPIGAFLILICSIGTAIIFCVVKLRKVPLIVWDIKRR